MFVTVDYKEGDKVVCSTDRLKNFSKGNIYTIEKITYNKKYAFMNMPHLGGRDGFVDKLKLKGISGNVSHSNFEPIGPDEQRDITISQVFDEETKVTDTPTKNRKIDEVESKTYQMFELLMNRIARDRNRLEWIKDYNDFDTMISIITKGDRIWGIKESDFDCIKNMTISDLMTLFIKYRQEKV